MSPSPKATLLASGELEVLAFAGGHHLPAEDGGGHHLPAEDGGGHHLPAEDGGGHHLPAEDGGGHHLPAEDGGGHHLPAEDGGAPPPAASVEDSLARAFAALRALSARENVARLGRDQGYRIEDVERIDVRGLDGAHVARASTWLARRLPPRASVSCEIGAGPLSLRALIAPRAPEQARSYHVDHDGRVAVESVELHVVEHCNLRCAQCCNVSPYLPARSMSVADVRATCERLREVVCPDVLKIMGGEPLLHPDLGALLHAVRASGVAPRMRLFTNGLLLRTLDDEAFSALDELTVSSYASAPLRAEIVTETEERARRFDVVLNVKQVDSFSTVLSRAPRGAAEAQAAYDGCWLRHRCLVVRGGVFYKCTRAAYHADYHAHVDLEARDADAEAMQRAQGIPLDAADFAPRLAAYLGSCP